MSNNAAVLRGSGFNKSSRYFAFSWEDEAESHLSSKTETFHKFVGGRHRPLHLDLFSPEGRFQSRGPS